MTFWSHTSRLWRTHVTLAEQVFPLQHICCTNRTLYILYVWSLRVSCGVCCPGAVFPLCFNCCDTSGAAIKQGPLLSVLVCQDLSHYSLECPHVGNGLDAHSQFLCLAQITVCAFVWARQHESVMSVCLRVRSGARMPCFLFPVSYFCLDRTASSVLSV